MVQQVLEQERESIYNDLKAAAESGWDFSYRWCIRTNKNANLSLVNVSTSYIIPVDLNAMLQRNAKMLARFHVILGNVKVSLLLHLGQSSEMKMAAKKEEIINRCFLVVIDSLKYKKTKFKSATTLREALGSN